MPIFGCMPFGCYTGYSNYDSGFSGAMFGLGAATSILNGVANGLKAKNNGADDAQAALVGMGTASLGLSNSAMGYAWDNATHTYWGSSTAGLANCSLYNSINFGFAPYMTMPWMCSPMMYTPVMPFGCGCSFIA